MDQNPKALNLVEHGIWSWDGTAWELVSSYFEGKEPPFNPNRADGPVRIIGEYVGQRMIFPLDIVIGSNPKPYSVKVYHSNGIPLANTCICRCQSGAWIPVQDYCDPDCQPSCATFDVVCQEGSERAGVCICPGPGPGGPDKP